MKKTKVKSRPKPAPAKRAQTTALARRVPSTVSRPRVEVLPASPVIQDIERRRLGDDIVLGELGLVELKLTPEEEKVLSEPAPLEEIRVKPDGAVYLSHPTYTRWFNRAFGRLGWAMVPVSKPMKSGNSVVVPYVLHVHKQPVAYANGEQEYFENNKQQTYGDALESTVASALRRLAKRLGVGLELWDREFSNGWRADNCVKVKVQGPKDDKPKTQWRRHHDQALPYELKGRSSRRDEEDDDEPRERRPPAEQRAGSHAHQDELITQPQRQRLVLIIRNSGREESQVADWLKRRFSLDSLKGIKRRDYDYVCNAIEAPGDLPR